MTRKRTKQLLASGVIQAWANGEALQTKSSTKNEDWKDWTDDEAHLDPRFDESLEWRVKPSALWE